MLWDVSILFMMALFDVTSMDLKTMERSLALPPAKFLELVTDHLLTGYFRGVGIIRRLVHMRNKLGMSSSDWIHRH